MSKRQLTNEEQIISTRSIFNSSYDLSSGGIPTHAHMLEQIVEGRKMDAYARGTFLSLSSSTQKKYQGSTR